MSSGLHQVPPDGLSLGGSDPGNSSLHPDTAAGASATDVSVMAAPPPNTFTPLTHTSSSSAPLYTLNAFGAYQSSGYLQNNSSHYFFQHTPTCVPAPVGWAYGVANATAAGTLASI